MDINRTFLTQLLDEKTLEKFKAAVARDKVILPVLVEILQHRQKQLNKVTLKEDFQNQAWPLERAFQDGKAAELSWLYDFITKE